MVSFISFGCWRLPVRSCLFWEDWCHLDYNILFVHQWKFLGVVLIGFNFCPMLWHNVFFSTISAVRTASSGSTRELALKKISSALSMNRNGRPLSQCPPGLDPPRFCGSAFTFPATLLLIQIISQIRYYAVNISDYLTQKVLSDSIKILVLYCWIFFSWFYRLNIYFL